MFRKSTIIKGLILLLIVGVLSGVGYKIKENIFEKKEASEKTQIEKQKQIRIKPLPPLEVTLQLKKKHPLLGDVVDVELITVAKRDIERAVLTFQVEGNLTFLGKDKIELGKLKKEVPRKLTTKIKISGIGKSTLKATVFAMDPQDKVLFGRAATLYFIVSEKEVLVGNVSFITLEIQRLIQKYKSGKIDKRTYQEQIHELLKGEAIETNELDLSQNFIFRKSTIIKGLILLLVVGVLVPTGFTVWQKFWEAKKREQQQEWKIYQNKKYGFKIRYRGKLAIPKIYEKLPTAEEIELGYTQF
jgi:hypothetical protein